jgi:hypothetical protein
MSEATKEIEPTFSNAELQQMLIEKQIEANEAKAELLKVQNSNASLTIKALKVHEENQMYKASPALAEQMAEMDFQLKMAERFIASKAFKATNAEQAYVIIKAGAEMGMKPVEAMQALYCVNGSVKIYGDKMVSRITKAGYKIEYLNESEQGVTVKVTNKEGFEAIEIVTANDPTLQKSNAYKFAPKNKMRFHAIRLIASFHLPHLFGSVQDEFTQDFTEWSEANPQAQLKSGIDLKQIDQSKEAARVLAHIERATSKENLSQVYAAAIEYGLHDEYSNKLETLEK